MSNYVSTHLIRRILMTEIHIDDYLAKQLLDRLQYGSNLSIENREKMLNFKSSSMGSLSYFLKLFGLNSLDLTLNYRRREISEETESTKGVFVKYEKLYSSLRELFQSELAQDTIDSLVKRYWCSVEYAKVNKILREKRVAIIGPADFNLGEILEFNPHVVISFKGNALNVSKLLPQTQHLVLGYFGPQSIAEIANLKSKSKIEIINENLSWTNDSIITAPNFNRILESETPMGLARALMIAMICGANVTFISGANMYLSSFGSKYSPDTDLVDKDRDVKNMCWWTWYWATQSGHGLGCNFELLKNLSEKHKFIASTTIKDALSLSLQEYAKALDYDFSEVITERRQWRSL